MYSEILQQTVIITGFVLVMMLLIEYLNVQSSGKWINGLKKKSKIQSVLGVILGAAPGCLGTYTAVSLYSHKNMGFSALLMTMILTTGDEAFFMLSLIPNTFVKITIILLIIGIIVSIALRKVFQSKMFSDTLNHNLEVHHHHHCVSTKSNIIDNFRRISFPRAILLSALIIFIIGLSTGRIQHSHTFAPNNTEHTSAEIHEGHQHNHEEHAHFDEHAHTSDVHEHGQWDWFNITLISVCFLALLIIATVPDHFLNEHLWDHIIKKHALKIFIWSLIILSVIFFASEYIDIQSWVSNNYFKTLIIALLIGIIPQSGPHLIFIVLFAQGTVPFSILLGNSIVQDGHGALPLLAESKKSFILIKGIKFVIALIIGIVYYFI
ncbi:MAG: putative manganese transporter [Hyphomicrobiales bacterium]